MNRDKKLQATKSLLGIKEDILIATKKEEDKTGDYCYVDIDDQKYYHLNHLFSSEHLDFHGTGGPDAKLTNDWPGIEEVEYEQLDGTTTDYWLTKKDSEFVTVYSYDFKSQGEASRIAERLGIDGLAFNIWNDKYYFFDLEEIIRVISEYK